MDKECCDIKVTEIDNGYRIEITGDNVKDCCEVALKKKTGCCEDKSELAAE